MGIGGFETVRGYHENQIVRDNGWIGSVELRVPLFGRPESFSRLEIAPFFDIGRGWNRKRSTPRPRTLAAAGIGARFALRDHFRAQLYWGANVRSVPDHGDHDLQDHGIHFSVDLAL